ncbi:MAG: hypothetical protein E7335_11930 [Clostridiales bacterium]|nr:hypothetical protein [Clostridiales bacterium]
MIIKKIYASSVAKLNSCVHNGGGDDDTLALQAVLDLAKDENVGVHLVMDGAALISQLKVWSNTTIECVTKDCGFYQKDWTNDSMITNAVQDHYEIKARNISLLGGTYHQNGQHQEHDIHRDNLEWLSAANEGGNAQDTVFVVGLEFYGVENLLIRDVTLRDFRTFGILIGCFKNVTLDQVWLDLPYGTRGNQDGFHFWGPGQFLTVLNSGGRVGDDVINVGPDEWDCKSSITDVLIDGIVMDEGEQAVRLLSRKDGVLDRVTIRNVTGTYRSFGFYISPWFSEAMGNFRNIFIENVDMQALPKTYDYRDPFLFSIGGNIENLTLKNIRCHDSADNRVLIEMGLPFLMIMPDDDTPLVWPEPQKLRNVIIDGLTITEKADDPKDTKYIRIYDKVENLIMRNVVVIKDQAEENGELLHFGNQGSIENFVCENIHTKGLKTFANDETKIKNRF